MPGQLKIVSVTMAPVNRNGISRPMLVTTGSSALRSACRKCDDPRREALGLGRADVVLAQRLEHARADEPAVARDVDHDEGDDRQDQVAPEVDEGADAGAAQKYAQ